MKPKIESVRDVWFLKASLCGVLLVGALPASIGAQQVPDSAEVVPGRPARLQELVTTASRTTQAIAESPFNVTAVTRADIATSSAPSVPNMLWRIPGFAMRDYQSSLASSPVRGVVSFRGLGGSSAGRTLVLLEGVPLNEPFSGWMHWSRVPLGLVERVEVVRGGGSMLWGSRALGGVINILTAPPAGTSLTAVGEGGSRGTYRGSLAGSAGRGAFRASLSADVSGTDGFVVVRPDQVGLVDAPSGQEDRVLYGRLSYDVSPATRLSVTGNYLSSESTGPTTISGSTARIGELRAGARVVTSGGGVVNVSTYGSHTTNDQLAVSVSSDRTTVRPNRDQAIRASSFGVASQWSQTVAGRHLVTVGLDASLTEGSLSEGTGYRDGAMTLERRTSGQQTLAGLFAQDNLRLSSRWRLQGGLRLDVMRNEDGLRKDTDLTSGEVVRLTPYQGATESQLNFNLGLHHEASSVLAWRATAYRAFRAPTPYELYYTRYSGRGQIVEANSELRPERLLGAELGADLTVTPRLLLRMTAFWNEVQDAVVDYTVGAAGAAGEVIEPCGAMEKDQICRQRRNVGVLATTGIESELEFRPVGAMVIWGSYVFNPSRISSPGQEIDGKVSRGAARHAATAVVSYDDPRLFSLTVEQRFVSSRTDDDLATIRLEEFFVTGLRVGRRLWRGADAYLKLDNLFDTPYVVTRAANGLEEIGAPRMATAGIRVTW